MKLRTIIVDDEPIARKVIKEYIEDIDYLELVGTAENPLKADILMSRQPVELLFLDINMPKLNGIEFLRAARNLPKVVITTAYAEYALEGFEWEVADYLVKPFSFERFLKACNKVRDHYLLVQRAGNTGQASSGGLSGGEHAGGGGRPGESGPGSNQAGNNQPAGDLPGGIQAVAGVSAGGQPAKGEEGYFFVKCDSRLEKVYYDELVYVEAMMNYIVLHTSDRKLIVYLTMKGILEHLPVGRFIQVHKSYIVNLAMVRSLEGNMISLDKGEVPISQHFYEKAMQEILQNRLIRRS